MRQLGLKNHAAESVRFGRHYFARSVQAVDRSEAHVLRIHRVLPEELKGYAYAVETSVKRTSTFRDQRCEKYDFDNISFKREVQRAVKNYLVVSNFYDQFKHLRTDRSSEECIEERHMIVC